MRYFGAIVSEVQTSGSEIYLWSAFDPFWWELMNNTGNNCCNFSANIASQKMLMLIEPYMHNFVNSLAFSIVLT